MFPFVPVTPQSELEFWSALCLPTNSKEPLYSPSSVDGSGLFHPIRQFQKKKKEKKEKLCWDGSHIRSYLLETHRA